MKKQVKYIDLHDDLFLPGIGKLGRTFPSPLQKFAAEVSYREDAPIVEFIVCGRKLLVPIALVKHMEVSNESKDSSK